MSPAMGQSTPASYTLTGVVRDFLESHPDFGVVPMAGFGSGAGSVDPDLGPDGVPNALNNVQSHGTNGVSTANVTVSNWSFDGGGATADDNKGGHDGTLLNGAVRTKGKFGKAMEFDGVDDFVEVPHHADFLVDEGTVTFWFNAQNSTSTQGLVTKDSTNYDTGGHFSVFVENGKVRWRLQSTSATYFIESPAGSIKPDEWHHVSASFGSLGMRLYLDGTLVDTNAAYTGGLGPSSGGAGNFEPWAFGVSTWNSADLSTTGWTQPFAGMIDQVQIFTGQIADTEYRTTGGYVVANQWNNASGDNIAPHLYGDAWCTDGSTPAPCFDPSGDTAGLVGPSSDGGISTTESFDDWFTDVLGVNVSSYHTINMVKDGSGVYEYSNLAFYPIDDQLFGNEGGPHNSFFTYVIEAEFTYEECTGQFFEFLGGDGAWLYLGGKLALDLGGMASNSGQYIELDRMCLQDGQNYSFHFFYANRQTFLSEFTLRTNVWLRQSAAMQMVSGPYD
ncbi:MAG: fibro-slime domain-containing protein [Planctomycetota bacterium]